MKLSTRMLPLRHLKVSYVTFIYVNTQRICIQIIQAFYKETFRLIEREHSFELHNRMRLVCWQQIYRHANKIASIVNVVDITLIRIDWYNIKMQLANVIDRCVTFLLYIACVVLTTYNKSRWITFEHTYQINWLVGESKSPPSQGTNAQLKMDWT